MKKETVIEANEILEDIKMFEKIIQTCKEKGRYPHFEFADHYDTSENERTMIGENYTNQLLEVIKTLKSNLETKLESL